MVSISQELGEWNGRRQAFGVVAARATASEAVCIRTIRTRKLYLSQTQSWDHFCHRFLGISRMTADRIIRHLEEFGKTYFELSQLIRISPETYRALQPQISEDGLEFRGEIIPIQIENTSRLAAAVQALQPRRPKSTDFLPSPADPFILATASLRDAVRRLAGITPLTPAQKRQLEPILRDLSLFL